MRLEPSDNVCVETDSNPDLAAGCRDYPRSSAAAHCGLTREPWLADASALAAQVGEWSARLRTEEDDLTVAALRRHTLTRRPLGSAVFLNLLETLLGRTVRPWKAGRHRKPG